jgi:peptide chain release factor subunit 1
VLILALAPLSSIAGENGFNQAIELAADSLQNVKFVQEKKLIQKYFDEIALDTGKFVFGIDDTLKALEMGAVETLIVWENLDVTRYVLRNAANGLWSLMWRWIVELSAELRLT